MLEELDRSAQVDSSLFWSLIKHQKKSPPVMVENLSYGGTTFQYQNVSNAFKIYFYDKGGLHGPIFGNGAIMPSRGGAYCPSLGPYCPPRGQYGP